MRKADVRIGEVYEVKVSGQLARVRLYAIAPHGGWFGQNLATGRDIRVRTAARLRRHVPQVGPEPDGQLDAYVEARLAGE